MADFSGEKAVDFWGRVDQQYTLDQPGPFKEPVDKLSSALNTYHSQLEKDVIDGDKVIRTPNVEFNYQRNEKDSITNAKAFAFTDRLTGNTYLAIDEDISNPDMFRLKVDANGLVVNIDNTEDDFGKSPNDIRLVTTAVKQITRSLEGLAAKDRRRREEIRGRVKASIGGLTTLAVVGGGVALGFEKLYFEPKAHDKAVRYAYDKEHHILPVTGVELQSQKVTVVPESIFSEIPSFKKHDTLHSPRTISVRGNNCEVKPVPSRPGDTLLIALQDGDPLFGSTVGAAVDSDRKHVTICLMGPASPGEDSKGGPEESKLALQLVPAEK